MNSVNGQVEGNEKGGTILRWSGRVLSAEDLRANLNGQGELLLSPKTVVTPMALDQLRAQGIRIIRQQAPAREEKRKENLWGYAQEEPHPQVASVVLALERDGLRLKALPAAGEGSPWRWARALAEGVAGGECAGGVVFCRDPGLVCCVANKVKGLRAVAVFSVLQAARAQSNLAANFIAVEMPGRTFFEVRQIIRKICASACCCPAEAISILQELEGHAHR